MSLWDRVRLLPLLLLAVAWLVLVWASMADNLLLPFGDAARIQAVESQWLLWPVGAEFVRQVHFLVSAGRATTSSGRSAYSAAGPIPAPPVLRLDAIQARSAYQDDITTRFSDVWGQDHVVERVKESIVFLENPDEIERKGGYVPSGLLLWGPPGTGKTLMAEAVASETGKPYVFVDPGAFTKMFMGVGILKVKSLFRKLRKLASYSTARRLEVGSPGGGRGGPQKGESTEAGLRKALADRIEDHLADLLAGAEAILRDNRAGVLALAHALETHKTLSGDDVQAVLDGRPGTSVDGRVYTEPEFVVRLEEYHAAAAGAHRSHSAVTTRLPARRPPAVAPDADGRGHRCIDGSLTPIGRSRGRGPLPAQTRILSIRGPARALRQLPGTRPMGDMCRAPFGNGAACSSRVDTGCTSRPAAIVRTCGGRRTSCTAGSSRSSGWRCSGCRPRRCAIGSCARRARPRRCPTATS